MASKREIILEYLRANLFPLVIAGANYTNTLKTIERGHRNPDNLGAHEFPALFITTSHEKRENITCNQFQATLQVVFVAYTKNTQSDPTDGTGVQQDLDKLIEDITKVLESDRLQGGRCTWTEITDVATDDGDLAPIGGSVISATFSYCSEGVAP